jgi:hypothetical protein
MNTTKSDAETNFSVKELSGNNLDKTKQYNNVMK